MDHNKGELFVGAERANTSQEKYSGQKVIIINLQL